MKDRETWLDIAKGLGIVLVVIGHSGNEFAHHYFFWFHMPLFFLLSGYTFKEITAKADLKFWVKKILKRSLVPYVSFGISLFMVYTLISVISNNFSLIEFVKSFVKLIYGGQMLTGYFGVFWFITCLLITQILFALILYFFKSHLSRISLIVSFFILAHVESYLIPSDIALPLNADIALLAIFYYSLGWYLKTYAKTLFRNFYLFLATTGLSGLTFYFEYQGYFNYDLDMKYRLYTNLLLDLFIPVLFSFLILFISVQLSKIKFTKTLADLGQKTLPIMYLHMPVNIIFTTIFTEYHWIIFTLSGIFIPLLFNLISEKFTFARFLFLGKPLTPSKNVLQRL